MVNGNSARFECIVQCDPYPNISWSRNGVPINQSQKYVIEFRNGVCRLTIPQAFTGKMKLVLYGFCFFNNLLLFFKGILENLHVPVQIILERLRHRLSF